MTKAQAKAAADSVVTLKSLSEITDHFRNMLAIFVRQNLAAYGWYAFTRGDEKVFVELVG